MKKSTLPAIIISVVFVAGIAAFFLYNHNSSPREEPVSNETIRYDPPTDSEKDAANEQKEINDANDSDIASTNNSAAEILITDSTQYGDTVEIRAYISNLIENNGSCITTLTKPGRDTITRTTQAFKDASSTQCGAIDIPLTDFSTTGEWVVTVAYESPTHSGVSEQGKVLVR